MTITFIITYHHHYVRRAKSLQSGLGVCIVCLLACLLLLAIASIRPPLGWHVRRLSRSVARSTSLPTETHFTAAIGMPAQYTAIHCASAGIPQRPEQQSRSGCGQSGGVEDQPQRRRLWRCSSSCPLLAHIVPPRNLVRGDQTRPLWCRCSLCSPSEPQTRRCWGIGGVLSVGGVFGDAELTSD